MNGEETNHNIFDEPHIKQLSNLYTGLLNNGSLYMLGADILKDLFQWDSWYLWSRESDYL